MIEIIVLYIMCKRIGREALARGVAPTSYQVRLVVYWIGLELFVSAILVLLFARQIEEGSLVILPVYLAAISSAALGGSIAFKQLREAAPNKLTSRREVAPATDVKSRNEVLPRESEVGSVRETLESIIIAFVLAFIFRAFVVEAFVIPTGSMAPTLLGEHVHVDCPQCGYRFTMGPRDIASNIPGNPAMPIQGHQTIPRENGPPIVLPPIEVPCPMCRFPIYAKSLRTDAGDRILVLKYVYTFNEPSRWDVVVFKNPTNPDENYIKRLVGLPGEQLKIAGGDVFTRDLNAAENDAWKIESKPDFVQRAVWQAVYRSNYYPLDGGKPAPSARTAEWTMPWRMNGSDGAWAHTADGPRFTFDASKGAGELAFDFSPSDPGGDHRRIEPDVNFYAYNMIAEPRKGRGEDPFRDMRVAATVAPSAEGARVMLTASDFEHVYRAVITDGKATLAKADRPDDADGDLEKLAWTDLATADGIDLPVGAGTRLELWLVDGELSLFVDGDRATLTLASGGETADRVMIPRVPTDAPHAGRETMPIVRVGVSGASATLRAVDLDRDLYYTPDGMVGTADIARIRPDHYYCLGDNSPQSRDGRLWNMVDDWVEQLADEPESQLRGYVPADLMIGRAFFVYFPAGYRVTEDSAGVLPNFGKMRFIH